MLERSDSDGKGVFEFCDEYANVLAHSTDGDSTVTCGESKPVSHWNFFLREHLIKSLMRSNIPSGVIARADFTAFAARLKPCPDTKLTKFSSFFASCEVVPRHFLRL